MMKCSIFLCSIVVVTLALTACIRPYKIDIQQGNVITRAMVDQLKPGMSKSEVIAIMGSPVLKSNFSAERLDYLYTARVGYGSLSEERVSLYFKQDKLIKITGTIIPNESAQ